MRKFTLLMLMAVSSAVASNAQRMIGVATSDWSGTNGMYLNPASLADSRTKFTIDLFSINAGADNDLGTVNKDNLFSKFFNGKDVGVNDVFKYDGKKTFNMLAPYAEVRGPGFMWNIDHKNTIALSTRVRGMSNLTDVDQGLYRTILDNNFVANNGVTTLSSGKFNVTAATWSEIGLSYGRVLVDNGKNVLKAGITARYLGGIGYVNMSSNHIDGTYNQNDNSLTFNNTNLNYSSNILEASSSNNGLSNNDLTSRFFGSNGGFGIGGDVGLSYEFRPNADKLKYDMDGKTNITDQSVNKYKLRISAAITDIGSINYNSSDNKNTVLTGNGTIKSGELNGKINNYQDFTAYANSHGFAMNTNTSSTRYHLPTALVAAIDYKLSGDFYLNATSITNLADKFQVGNYYYNQVTVTPRYDTRMFSVGLPVTYGIQASTLKLGLGVRVAGFFVGSDDMLALASNNQYGLNVYFGGYIPVNYKRPKDRDHDKVSDKQDKCPNIAGVWEYKGCPDPDTDHDGVFDSVDKCPTVAGSPTAMGCPDKDLDSVADAQDRCPDQAGSVAMQGCPDRDHDGIADIDDACPDQAGPAKFHGCPDRDGDGVPDNEDLCPDKAGPIATKGCPDTDNDGVLDNVDRCPTVKGPASNQGCPVVSEEVKKRLAFAATAIQFETGKAIIKKKSFPLLDEIVTILNNYPDYYMTIDGHTDNVGKPEANMILSQNRAASVKNYFVSKGISTNRITTAGHGETEPVATNKTAAGRAKNRRVAMDLKLMTNK